MGFKFEKFKYLGGRFSAKASIRSNGSIGLSQGAILRYKLAEGKWYAELFFDKDARVIGIRPTRDGDTESVTKIVVRKSAQGGKDSFSSFISARSLLNFYGIPIEKARSYPAEWDEEHQMIIIDLKKEDDQETEE